MIVAANGCTDRTAAVAASRPGVEVLDLPAPGKCAALNAADAIALGFPRIYLDADIHVTTGSLRLLRDSLDPAAGFLAAVPAREVDARGSSLLVRAYSAVNARLPVFRNSLFGRGLIVLSDEGRARFHRFPEIVADDLYLDSLFGPDEKLLVETVSTTVGAPAHAGELVRRLVRVRRGNAALRATSAGLRPPRGQTLQPDVVARRCRAPAPGSPAGRRRLRLDHRARRRAGPSWPDLQHRLGHRSRIAEPPRT